MSDTTLLNVVDAPSGGRKKITGKERWKLQRQKKKMQKEKAKLKKRTNEGGGNDKRQQAFDRQTRDFENETGNQKRGNQNENFNSFGDFNTRTATSHPNSSADWTRQPQKFGNRQHRVLGKRNEENAFDFGVEPPKKKQRRSEVWNWRVSSKEGGERKPGGFPKKIDGVTPWRMQRANASSSVVEDEFSSGLDVTQNVLKSEMVTEHIAEARDGEQEEVGAERHMKKPKSRSTSTVPSQIAELESKKKKGVPVSKILAKRNDPMEEESKSKTEYIKRVQKRNIVDTSLFSDKTLSDIGFEQRMEKNMKDRLNITRLTRIQELVMPQLLEGRDMFLKSQTGSGKTLAYVLPIIHDLQKLPQRVERVHGPYAIILAPTRELCLQIFEIVQTAVKAYIWLIPGVVMGGEKKKTEKSRIRKGINILIATPGRLLDHLQSTQNTTCYYLKWLVLDEADRLLDLGFERDVRRIMQLLVEQHQVEKHFDRVQRVLLSATLDYRVEKLADFVLSAPVKVGFTEPTEGEIELEDGFKVPSSLRQDYIVVPGAQKLVALLSFLFDKMSKKKGAARKAVVFFSSCDSVEFHHLLLSTITDADPSDIDLALETINQQQLETGKESEDENEDNLDIPIIGKLFLECPIYKLHGDIDQKERTKIFFEFCKVERGILLCTDVAARGLDLPAVDWIVQYDTPGEVKDYLHRVGRTARIGETGEALLFLLPSELEYITLLENLGVQLREVMIENTFSEVMKRIKKKDTDEAASWIQFLIQKHVGRDTNIYELAMKAFNSFLRSYATHTRDTKHIFNVRNLHVGHMARSFGLKDPPSSVLSYLKSKTGGKMSQKQVWKKEKMVEVRKEKFEKETAGMTEEEKAKFIESKKVVMEEPPGEKQRKATKPMRMTKQKMNMLLTSEFSAGDSVKTTTERRKIVPLSAKFAGKE